MSKKEARVEEKEDEEKTEEKTAQKGDRDKKKPGKEKAQVLGLKEGEKFKEDLKYIVRIAGADLDGRKKLKIVLPKVKGVGYNFANAVLRSLNFDENIITGEMTDEQVVQLEAAVKNPTALGIPTFMFDRQKDPVEGTDMHWVGTDWEYGQMEGIEFLKKIKTYRGMRHFYGLKLRGQRTGSRGAAQHGRSGKTIGVVRKKLMPGQQPGKKGEEEKK